MKYLIGIDPGRKTGLAIYDRQKKQLENVTSTDFWGLISFLSDFKARPDIKVYIENPNGNSGLYLKRSKALAGYSESVKLETAQRIGRNKEQAYLIIEYCSRYDIPHIALTPTKRSGTKKNSTDFKKLTGYGPKTNEHGRDAAMLVFGR